MTINIGAGISVGPGINIGNQPPVVVTANLQLYLNAADSASYPGSGTAWTDLSANGYVTTLVGAPTWNTTYFTFDGTTEYVDTNQSLASETFTVGAWFNTSASGINMILSKETTAGWPWNYRIWLNSGQIVGDIAQSGGSNQSLSSPLSTYASGAWYSVMFGRDTSDLYLWVNGLQIATTPNSLAGSITNAQELWVGRSAFTNGGASPTGSYQYTGDIGQIMVYDRLLSGSEVLQNFNATRATYGV